VPPCGLETLKLALCGAVFTLALLYLLEIAIFSIEVKVAQDTKIPLHQAKSCCILHVKSSLAAWYLASKLQNEVCGFQMLDGNSPCWIYSNYH
jgi:hypothetical protein